MRVSAETSGSDKAEIVRRAEPEGSQRWLQPSARRDLGVPHGMPTTHADVINADLLTFIQS